MLVKVFESEDMASALKKVKETLGPDALILSTRTVRKGPLGMLGKPMLEVTAAIESPNSKTPGPRRPAAVPAPPKTAPAARRTGVTREKADDLTYDELWKKNKVIDPVEGELRALKGQIETLNVGALKTELAELKELIRGIVKDTPRGYGALMHLPQTVPQATTAPGNQVLEALVGRLVPRGIERDAAESISRFALQKLPPAAASDPRLLDLLLEEVIAEMVQVAPPARFGTDRGPRCVALIGPTGVGKTTTVAKLAADYLLNHGKRLVMITIDTFRIAAVEQLKVYGEIMRVPVEVVMTPEQLRKTLTKHQDKELILIDTAGRSPRDDHSLEELTTILGAGFVMENHLVLSATTRETDLNKTIARFSRLPIKSVIFTKLDECESLGCILNVHLHNSYPLSYLTTGQRVPQDILVAEPKRVASLIMGNS